MAKLTDAQRKTLAALANADGWQSAYDLQVSLSTLRVLRDRGLVTSKAGAGYMAFPRNGIEWRLTEAGKQAQQEGDNGN